LSYIPINNAEGVVVNVATTTLTRDGVPENMELTTLADPISGLQPNVNNAGDLSASVGLAIQGMANMNPVLTLNSPSGSSNSNITSVLIGLSSTTVLIPNPSRAGFIISCVGSAIVYIAYGPTADVNTMWSIALAPGQSPYIDTVPYRGAISAIVASGAATLQITELS
jgi:hypothetical protein